MNITYKDLNDKEIIIFKQDFINLLDEYTELQELVQALQEVTSKVVNLRSNVN